MTIDPKKRSQPHAADYRPSLRPYHRIRAARELQCLTLRTVSRRLHVSIAELKAQEDEHFDMRLSTLYRWREALEVPIAELLTEPSDVLSDPILRRASLVRLMKTASAILERASDKPIRRFAHNLVQQLTELMPELHGVSPWNSTGPSRPADELGRIAEHSFPDSLLTDQYSCPTW